MLCLLLFQEPYLIVEMDLKPVHRRILYAMNESGYNYNKAYKKSARIVGDVMGKYHPHGDAAIYDSMVTNGTRFFYASRINRWPRKFWFSRR